MVELERLVQKLIVTVVSEGLGAELAAELISVITFISQILRLIVELDDLVKPSELVLEGSCFLPVGNRLELQARDPQGPASHPLCVLGAIVVAADRCIRVLLIGVGDVARPLELLAALADPLVYAEGVLHPVVADALESLGVEVSDGF